MWTEEEDVHESDQGDGNQKKPSDPQPVNLRLRSKHAGDAVGEGEELIGGGRETFTPITPYLPTVKQMRPAADCGPQPSGVSSPNPKGLDHYPIEN